MRWPAKLLKKSTRSTEVNMVDLPQKKVGIVACSGEELAEGTVTRLAALKVLEQLRPKDTVTICLPLFLAGGEGERAFARFYPTIAVTELLTDHDIGTMRQLNEAGHELVSVAADRTAGLVDQLLGKKWDR